MERTAGQHTHVNHRNWVKELAKESTKDLKDELVEDLFISGKSYQMTGEESAKDSMDELVK